MINVESLFKISYGLYIVCSGDEKKGNGFVSNTFFQVTAEPPMFAACCNKNNFTSEFIIKHHAFSVSVLAQNVSSEIFGKFGFKSGRDFNKMLGMQVKYGNTGVPIILNNSIAFFECKLIQTVDLGTHLMFIGELIQAELIDSISEPLTYKYYREIKKGIAPKNAPTFIDKSKFETKLKDQNFKKYKCPACGYIFDESLEKVRFVDLPNDWICPVCGSEKSDFIEIL
jgi:flavin reductase (DIM6/NTAB) family NADH-FMN oxidoreductase RutF/rubredoxin